MLPLADNEFPQWAGRRLPFLAMQIAEGYKIAEQGSYHSELDYFGSLAATLSLEMPAPILEPHKMFEY